MSYLVTNTGAPLFSSSGTPIGQFPSVFVDSFQRPNGPLGNGWTDGWDWDSSAYEPLGIYNGSAVVRDPVARTGAVYAADQVTNNPPLNGEQYVGIGCAWREFGTASVYLELEWSGLIDIDAGHHVEGAPIVHVVPGSPEHGLGFWPGELFGSPAFLIASIGNPPESFPSLIYDWAIFTHTDGTPRKLGILTNGLEATFWLDGGPGIGTQISLITNGLNPLPVPANLQNSTLHGFELDTHMVSPPNGLLTNTPTTPVVHSIIVRPV